jgi:hypothetical protein
VLGGGRPEGLAGLVIPSGKGDMAKVYERCAVLERWKRALTPERDEAICKEVLHHLNYEIEISDVESFSWGGPTTPISGSQTRLRKSFSDERRTGGSCVRQIPPPS